ncbi:MAG: ATP-binding protein [Candidatus Verstraetearchaeota archaeon]|nr:ATP-binding protein [Candidatus Verstraetearchaeota archaeon]
MGSERLIYLTAATAAFALLASWLSIFPPDAQIDYNSIFIKSTILAVLLLGSFFLRNTGAYLKLGWAAIVLGFLVDLLSEFTAEPEVLSIFMAGLLIAGGFILILYGLMKIHKKMDEGSSLARSSMGPLKSMDGRLSEMFGTDQSNIEDVRRLATMGQVAAMVGHDLRNPLQAIVYSVYDTEEEIRGLPEDTRKLLEERGFIAFLEKLKKQVACMNKMVTDLQDYAKSTKPEFYAIDLHGLVEEALKSVSRPENVAVVVKTDPALGLIRGDPQLIRRAFINLITNAFQAMPEGGSLEVSISREGDYAQVSFSDTGVGISPENIKKLFDPFFTTKAKGMGLGLAICKKMIEAHHGSIDVQSELGKGTRFTIRIPIK